MSLEATVPDAPPPPPAVLSPFELSEPQALSRRLAAVTAATARLRVLRVMSLPEVMCTVKDGSVDRSAASSLIVVALGSGSPSRYLHLGADVAGRRVGRR